MDINEHKIATKFGFTTRQQTFREKIYPIPENFPVPPVATVGTFRMSGWIFLRSAHFSDQLAQLNRSQFEIIFFVLYGTWMVFDSTKGYCRIIKVNTG